METKNFIVEEFKSNWDYLKHIEDVRAKLFQLYVIIIAAILSVISALYKASNGSINDIKIILLALSGFVAIYGVLYINLIKKQKDSYEKYRAINSEIRKIIYADTGIKLSQEFFNKLKEIEPYHRNNVVFSSWIYLPLSFTIISIVAFILLVCK